MSEKWAAVAALCVAAGCGVDNVKFTAPPAVELVVSKDSAATIEGERVEISVALSARPRETVVVTLRSSDVAKVAVTPSELVFEPESFDVAQTVTVLGVVDRNFDNEQATISIEGGVVAAVSLPVTVVECPTLAAQDFWLLFNPNSGSSGRREVYAAGEPGTLVSVAGAAPAPIPAEGLLVVDIGLTRVPVYNTVETGKSFQVTASAPVQVFANNYERFTVDAFTAVPNQLLGMEYRAIGYRTQTQSQIAVYAIEDNTAVTIGSSEITLNRGQSYVRNAPGDITGTRVSANKPIAVNSGDYCMSTGVGACDHVEEMLFPVGAWASDTFVPLIPQSQDFRVVAHTDGTEVRVDGVLVATLTAGQFYNGSGGGKRVQTSQPAQVYIIALGESNCDGDPAFVLLPGTQNATQDTTFSALTPTNVNTLVVSMPTEAVASLRLDGQAVTPTWVPYASGGYSHARIPVTAGTHKLSASAPFLPVVWGDTMCESYGYVAAYGYPRARCELP